MDTTQEDVVIGYTYEDVERMASDILRLCPFRPTLAIICGTGLANLAATVDNATVIPYDAISGFPACTVKGHHGKFVVGKIKGKAVILMVGRFHYYEGYPMWKVSMPVRVMKALGVDTLLITCAVGGLNRHYKRGDMMVIKDHLDLPGMVGANPLRGHNDERFGPRFLSTNSIYDQGLRKLLLEVGQELGVSDRLREGVYVMQGGPTFVTLAEINLLRLIGADAVGMSTVPEAVVAKHSGMRVAGLAIITDVESQDEQTKTELTHEAVLKAADEMAPLLQNLVTNFIARMP